MSEIPLSPERAKMRDEYRERIMGYYALRLPLPEPEYERLDIGLDDETIS